jgi:CheY-like chemotaxis protein
LNVRLHCLIVDTHSTTALALKSALSVMGFSTFGFASSAPQAAVAARTRRPDLVITSVKLDMQSGDIGEAPVIYVGDEAGGVDGDIVLDRPIGRAALANAWERLREEVMAAT